MIIIRLTIDGNDTFFKLSFLGVIKVTHSPNYQCTFLLKLCGQSLAFADISLSGEYKAKQYTVKHADHVQCYRELWM